MTNFFSEDTLRLDIQKSRAAIDIAPESPQKTKDLETLTKIEEEDIAYIIYNFKNNSEIRDKLDNYCYEELIGWGGSGLVFRVKVKNDNSMLGAQHTNKFRALKVSRASATECDFDKEVSALYICEHSNITRYYDHYLSQDRKFYLLITEYVEKACNIDKYIDGLAKKLWENDKLSLSGKISDTCELLAEKLLSYGETLSYMHDTRQLYHMDVKPGNLLVSSKTDKPYVTDLGFARCKDHYEDIENVTVGFTVGYQHPDLSTRDMLITTTGDRAKNIISKSKLGPKYDLYSFGRTILGLLNTIKNVFGNQVHCNYKFMFLHFLATLMLDGKNQISPINVDIEKEFLDEYAFGIYKQPKEPLIIQRFSDFNNRIKRLLNQYDICDDIPELHPSPQMYDEDIGMINHGTGDIPETKRIQSIIEHPALIRLKNIKHLGVVHEIYPGATHNRYAHTLGVTDYVIRFIKALYNDPHNPIFKIILTKSDVKKMILHGLVHDIGHTEFGHEFEELDKQVFNHKDILITILTSEWKDGKGRTLNDLVQSDNHDGWGIKMDDFIAHIKRQEGDSLYIYNEIIDGRFDADKLDYLQRDARNCNVPYARGLDKKRFFSCITCIPVDTPTAKDTCFRLGIKEKGKVSLLKISETRREMYASVYLHHKVRTLRAMILTACNNGLQNLKNTIRDRVYGKNAMQNIVAPELVTELFLHHLSNESISIKNNQLSQHFQKRTNKPRGIKGIGTTIGETVKDTCNRFVDDSLTLLLGFIDEKHLCLYEDYKNRIFYTCLFGKSLSEITDRNKGAINKKFEWEQRERYIEELEQMLLARLYHVIGNTSKNRLTVRDAPMERVESLREERLLIILDTPLRTLSDPTDGIYVMKDNDRKNGKLAIDKGEVKEITMNDIIFYRILVHPEFYKILHRFGLPDNISDIIFSVFPEFRSSP